MSRPLLILLVLLLASVSSAQEQRNVRVGLLRDMTVKRVMVMSTKGSCTVLADGERRGELTSSDGLRVEFVPGGGIVAKSLSLDIKGAQRIDLVPVRVDGGFRMRPLDHKLAERSYPGTLTVTSSKNALSLVNTAPLEPYTAGVVRAEAGRGHHPEYYKLQSVSCRTYALTNARKHLADGFELCDGVHCQVFNGLNTDSTIQAAVEATAGLVLVDANIRLIHATFHSNCGGETVNAEDIWGRTESYLRATVDTFCLSGAQARWSRTFTRTEWLNYLRDRFKVKVNDPEQRKAVLNYQPACRDLYLANTWPQVPLKHVREDLKLRSTFFSVREEGDKVVLEGRGFGHGVGLCQEGSMRMALAGRSYADILRHYYSDVHLVDISTIAFFREEAAVPESERPDPGIAP